MRMMRFNPVAEYVPGSTLHVADTLSRHPVNDATLHDIHLVEGVNAYVGQIQSAWPASDDKLQQYRESTSRDATLSGVMQYTVNGWPQYRSDIPEQYSRFHDVRAHLSVASGLLLYENQIVIPHEMRQCTLERIHDGHMGVTKCRERAKSSVWWHGMSKDISDMVESCAHCQTNQPAQRKQPLITTDLPGGPWQRIATDLCVHEGQSYLVVTDYYSRYLDIVHMTSTTSSAVVKAFKSIFARWGIPHECVSDNGPQFSADEFAQFAMKYGFSHVTSSPHQPHANGAAERAVQVAKSILKQDDPCIALMAYRATPLSATGYSPSQLMMGRTIRTTLPTLQRNLAPRWPDPEKVRENDDKAKSDYRYYYNRRHSARPLQDLAMGSTVRVRTNKDSDWSQHGTVTPSKSPSLRSESILMESGRTLRRDRQDVRLDTSTLDQPPEQSDTSDPMTTLDQPSGQPDRPPDVFRSQRIRKPTKRLIEQ